MEILWPSRVMEAEGLTMRLRGKNKTKGKNTRKKKKTHAFLRCFIKGSEQSGEKVLSPASVSCFREKNRWRGDPVGGQTDKKNSNRKKIRFRSRKNTNRSGPVLVGGGCVFLPEIGRGHVVEGGRKDNPCDFAGQS